MNRAAERPTRGSVRTRLLALVEREPGIHKAELARRLRVGWTTVQHHSRVLAASGLVREVDYLGLRVLLPANLAPSRMQCVVVLAAPDHRRILMSLIASPGRRIQELATELGWSRKTVRRCCYELVRVGLLSRSHDYRPRFRVTPLGLREARRLRPDRKEPGRRAPAS